MAKENHTRLYIAKVMAVDRVKWTVTIQGQGGQLHEGVQVGAQNLDPSGGGSYWLPKVNSLVVAATLGVGGAPFVLCSVAAPQQLTQDPLEDPNDGRMNRPVLNEGDHVIAAEGQGAVILRRDGTLEFGASPLAKRVCIPLKNIVHDFFENYVMDWAGGGQLSFRTRREDQSFGEKIPVEFQLAIKEFAEDETPMIDVRLGRIQAEDETYIPPDGVLGEIVARFVINNAYRVFIDKSGNAMTYASKSVYESVDGTKNVFANKGLITRVRGLMTQAVGSAKSTVSGNEEHSVGGTSTRTVRGDSRETLGGSLRREIAGTVLETTGATARVINGDLSQQVAANESSVVGGGRRTSTGENVVNVTGGTYIQRVGNTKLAPVGYEFHLATGEMRFIDSLGKILFASGGLAEAASSKITIKPTGAVVVESLNGVVRFETNPTGVSLKTPAGEITIDVTGKVALGPGPLRGAVVTTLTHPFDYVTGAPILGSAFVGAGGPPSPVAIPVTFIPDVS